MSHLDTAIVLTITVTDLSAHESDPFATLRSIVRTTVGEMMWTLGKEDLTDFWLLDDVSIMTEQLIDGSADYAAMIDEIQDGKHMVVTFELDKSYGANPQRQALA